MNAQRRRHERSPIRQRRKSGLLIGLLLVWAEHPRLSGGWRHWRWLALSPLLFAAVLFSEGPLGVLGLFEEP